MNELLRHYLHRLNHTQRLIRDANGHWLWLHETATPAGETIRLCRPAGSENCETDGPLSNVVIAGAQSSAVLLPDGRLAIAAVDCNKAEVRYSDAWHQSTHVLSSDEGSLLIGNLVHRQGQLILPWARQCSDTMGQVGICVQAVGGSWQHYPLQQARGAFAPHALVHSDGRLHLVWALADQRIFHMAGTVAGFANEPLCIARDGYQPTLVETDDGSVLVAYESHFAYPRSVVVRNGDALLPHIVSGRDPRFHYSVAGSLQLVRDEHGVPTLFWVDRYRHHVFYSRWLGDIWGPVLSVPSLHQRTARDERSYASIDRIYASGVADERGIGIVIEPESGAIAPAFRAHIAVRPDEGTTYFFDLRELTQASGFRHGVQAGKKNSANPLIPAGPSGSFNCYRAVNRCTVLHDGDRYRMWLTGTAIPDRDIGYKWWTKLRSGYSQSDDGLHWAEPREIIGLPGQHAVYCDPTETSSNRRYKFIDFPIADEKLLAAQQGELDLLALTEPGRLFYSADGQQWQSQPITLHAPGGMYFEHCPMCLLHDPGDADQPWKSYGYASLTLGRRANSLATSHDLVHWTLQPEPALPPERHGYPLQPAGPPQQVHGMTVHRIGRYYVALVQYQQDAKCSTIELAVSRDGRHFDPVQAGRPLIDRGPAGAWDEGMLMPAGFVTGDDAWRVYYTGTNLPADGASIGTSAGLAEFEPDGLCTLEMTGQTAMLKTVPVTLQPGVRYRLFIRSQNMELNVEIIAVGGRTIDCSRLRANGPDNVQFDAPEEPVQLVLRASATGDARLFSFAFHPVSGQSA